MKLKTLALGLFCLATAVARADYNPVPLTPSSYTFDIVVESNAPLALPYCINGTSGGNAQSSNTLYEQGLYARPGQPGGSSGIPLHNTTFTDVNNSNVHFLMPPDYTTNNNLQVDSTHVTGTLTFVTPTTSTNLAFLSGGGGAVVVGVTVTHSDASTEIGSISCATAFTPGVTPVAWACNGWITVGGTFTVGSLTNVNTYPGGAGPFLYRYNMTVSSATPIVSVTFTYSSGGNEGDFYAISGNAAGATWTPIPVTGFNIRSTVPGNFPVTATMDQGTNTQQNANLATWFERGYVPGSPTNGLPPSGSIFNSSSQPTHHYQMANYQSNNGILIDTNHLFANIIPASPAPYNAFSLLTAGGNVGAGSKMTNRCILQHADGVNETNIFYGYDWFETSQPSAVAWVASGRVNMANRTINNLGTLNPKLFETFFFLKDTTSPVTNILLQYVHAPNAVATTFIMAVSATAGGIPIIFDTNTIAQNVYSGNSALFNASLAAGTVPAFSWQKSSATNGPWSNLTDGPTGTGSVVSGSASSNLVISSIGPSDVAYYQCVGTNGVTTTLTTTPPIPLTLLVNTNVNILATNDSLADFGSTSASPAGETVVEASDGTLTPWFANGTDSGFAPFTGPVGFVVTPQAGNTVVTGLRVFASNNNPLDDPYDIMLEGSDDGGNTWTTIYADAPLGLSNLRNPASGPIVDASLIETEVDFPSAGGYFTYRVTFQHVKDNEGANNVAGTLDIGEIELLGYVNPIPPVITSGPGSLNKTLYVGANFSAAVTANGPQPITYQWYFNIPAPQRPRPLTYFLIEPDASAASYFFGAAAITGGSVGVGGWPESSLYFFDAAAITGGSVGVQGWPESSLQGDLRFVDVLAQMGCRVKRERDTITVHGGALHGIDVDMNDISDTVMTLAAVACFAEGPTTIRNVAHIRHKETDRLAALATELRRIGAGVDERADGLTITPAPLHGAVVETYNDHRMAMSLALVGLKIPGIVIDHPACVAKTYPGFFDDLEQLRC